MAEEDEAKMKKMRLRIERDSYSVLLSFKDGATPRQVESRMDDTLGYTYHSKYHLAGVYDMSQILREHAQVQATADGKFKIIATKENEDLVALISRQKENKRKRGGFSQRGGAVQRGRRPMTSIGHHRNPSGLFSFRNSPRGSTVPRPFTSMSRPFTQKPLSNVSNIHKQVATSSSFVHPSNPLKPPVSGRNVTFTGIVKTPVSGPCIQRPLVRPATAPSVSAISASRISNDSTSTVITSSKITKPLNHMPSIKEFTDKAKRMMLKIYPDQIHLSEVSELYLQEYGVLIEPLQLYSKRLNVSITNPSTRIQPNQSLGLNSTLPTSQGFRYQVPQPKSSMEVVNQKMRGLNVEARTATFAHEKPSNFISKISSKESKKVTSTLSCDNQQKTITQTSSVFVSSQKPIVTDHYYDSRQLKNLKYVEKSDELKCNLDAVLNEIPELKKITRKNAKSSVKNGKQPSPPGKTTQQVNAKVVNKITTNATSVTSTIPNVTPSDMERSSYRSAAGPSLFNRLFGRAVADIHKQNHLMLPTRHTEPEKKTILDSSFVPTRQTEPEKNVILDSSFVAILDKEQYSSASARADSDDGWGSPQLEKNIQKELPATRKVPLPPMSKGANVKPKNRSRQASCTRSISSQDAITAAMNATLPDDEQW
uniref:HTH OST-type domain-containing protein n=1 Tax=Caenorhabditis tropicalis TaxID=1561998 RepID=A0A1I7TEP2_9PELO